MPRKAAAQYKPGMLSAEAQKIAASEFGNDMLVGTKSVGPTDRQGVADALRDSDALVNTPSTLMTSSG